MSWACDGDDFASHIPGISEADAERRRAAFRNMASDGQWLPVPDADLLGVTEPEDVAVAHERLTLWDSIETIKRSSGDDTEVAHIEPEGRSALSEFDEFALD
jgi:hypothetical protein